MPAPPDHGQLQNSPPCCCFYVSTCVIISIAFMLPDCSMSNYPNPSRVVSFSIALQTQADRRNRSRTEQLEDKLLLLLVVFLFNANNLGLLLARPIAEHSEGGREKEREERASGRAESRGRGVARDNH